MNIFSQYKGLRRENYILFYGRVVTGLGSTIWPMMTLILNQKMGYSAGMISVILVVGGTIMLPANLLGGVLADRYNKKNNIVFFDAVSVIGYVICAFMPLGRISILLILLSAICQSVEYPSYNALIADLTTTDQRERAYSLQYLGANLGLVLSPTIAGILFRNYLWLAFLISGLSIASSTLMIAFGVRDITPVEETGEQAEYQKAADGVPILEVLKKNRTVLLYVCALALYYAAYNQFSFMMPLDMGVVHGEAGAVIFGTVNSLNCIIVVIFTPLITNWFQRLSATGKTLAGELLVTAGYMVFLLLLGHIPAYYLAMTLFTWGEVFATIAEGPYLTRRIPASHRGRINGVSSVIQSVMISVCQLSVGYTHDAFGMTAAWSLVFVILGTAILITLILAFRDRKAYPGLYGRRPDVITKEEE